MAFIDETRFIRIYGRFILHRQLEYVYTRCTRASSCLGKSRIPRPEAGLSRKTLAYSKPRAAPSSIEELSCSPKGY